MTSGRHLVVLAGADAGAVDELAATLRDDGAVRTAYGPTALRETLDDEVDVVLVDSDFGDGPLESVLDDLRARDGRYQIAVLGTDPGRCQFGTDDLVDAFFAWDAEAVRETVSRLATRARYRRRLDEYYALAEERAAVADGDDEATQKRERLDRQVEELRRDLADGFRRIDDRSAFDAALSPDDRSMQAGEPTATDGQAGEASVEEGSSGGGSEETESCDGGSTERGSGGAPSGASGPDARDE